MRWIGPTPQEATTKKAHSAICQVWPDTVNEAASSSDRTLRKARTAASSPDQAGATSRRGT